MAEWERERRERSVWSLAINKYKLNPGFLPEPESPNGSGEGIEGKKDDVETRNIM